MSHVSKYTRSVYFHFQTVRKIYERYLKSVNFPKNEPWKAMDIGCGSGRILLEVVNPLLPKNCNELIATDKDKAMIDYCKSLKCDSKIAFKQLDMDTPNLPDNFKGYFDILFSNYCFQFLRNFRQGLENSHNMLKPGGELLFLFHYPGNPMHWAYKEMSKMDIWKPYMRDFADYKPYFSEDNRDSEMKQLFEEAGLTILANEFRPENFYEARAQQIIDLFDAMDCIYDDIPEDKKQKYKSDYRKIAFDGARLSAIDYEKPQEIFKVDAPLAIVHAVKDGKNPGSQF